MICLFDDEDKVELNEHQIAWMQMDWDKVKELSDQYKEKPENELFVILNNINSDKNELNVDQFDSYSKFMIDSMLSRHMDCIQSVYMSNMILHGLPDQAHHNYLMLTIPRGRRYSKSTKLDETLKDKYILKLLMVYYKVNSYTAYTYKNLLTKIGKLDEVLKSAKAMANDDFLKTITKNPKELKELKLL